MNDLKFLPIEFDAKAIKDDGSFEGYASTFGNVDQGYDVVMPGAFARSLKDRPAFRIKMLWQHNPSEPIGAWTEAKEDDKGLFVKGALLKDVQKGAEAYTLMKAGAIDSMSIGYRTLESEYTNAGVRQLKELGLMEISLVTFPMNEQATVTTVKNDWNERDLENVLREAGMSKEFAKRVTLHGLKRAKEQFDRREADGGSESGAHASALSEAMQALQQAFR